MERLSLKSLLAWKNSSNRKPLIIRGARQVGKSYSMYQFGETYFSSGIVSIDFELQPGLSQIFEQDLDPKRIVTEIEQNLGVRILPGKTLLFLDEIQRAPRVIMSLRYFYENMPDLHVIAAGSLLDFALKDQISFPVGRVNFLDMYPMNFYEVLLALGYDKLATLLLDHPSKISQTSHEKLRELLKIYFFIGGMPEAVRTYVETHSIVETQKVHESLIYTYIEDFSKYAPLADKTCMHQIFASVSRSIGSQIIYSNLAEHYSNKTISKDFHLLSRAQIIQRVLCTRAEGLPLDFGVNHKKFKAIMIDIGILQSIVGSMYKQFFLKTQNLLDIYRGALAEQFVGQELRLTQNGRLYYWARDKRGSSAEVDYLSVIDGNIVPIEVKSGPSGKLRSLHLLLNTYPQIKRACVFYDGIYQNLPDQKLEFFPLYFVFGVTRSETQIK
ncbi:ATP-binding protein [bacterium]